MSSNTFGHSFRVTTFGESHGPGVGCVIDGCPPGLELKEEDIEFPDKEASDRALDKLSKILSFHE